MNKNWISRTGFLAGKGAKTTLTLIGRCLLIALASLLIGLGVSGALQAASTVAGSQPTTEAAAAIAQPINAQSPAISSVFGADGLRMNFHGAPLNLVLDYLSEAAGLVINKQAEVRGNIEVWSKQPVSKDEAVELLGSVLRKAGYAVARNGRILTIMALESVKTADTEIAVSADPKTVEKSEEVQTQVIPVQYASAAQLVPNLEQLLSTTATLSANESANTLILVATKIDIKRILKIVNALDTSMASSSSIKVRPLRYGNAKEIASIIAQLYAQRASSQASLPSLENGPNFGGGPPGGPFDGFPPSTAQNTGSASPSGRGSISGRVTALADDRSNSVVLSAPADLLAGIENMVDKLDQPMGDLTELRVFRLRNAVPSELADQLAQLFPDESNSNNRQNDNMPFFFPGGVGQGGSSVASAASEHLKKLGKVLAVPDYRTSSLIVTASKSLMPQVAGMISALDADQGKREVVSYFELRNADPQDISQNLQDLFNRTGRLDNNNQNSFLGRNHPLTQRQTQNQQSTTTSSTATTGQGSAGGSGSRAGQL